MLKIVRADHDGTMQQPGAHVNQWNAEKVQPLGHHTGHTNPKIVHMSLLDLGRACIAVLAKMKAGQAMMQGPPSQLPATGRANASEQPEL